MDPRLNRHAVVCALSGASLLAFLAAPGQGTKTIAMLATLFLVIVSAWNLAMCLFDTGVFRRLVVFAFPLALARCVGERAIVIRDHAQVISELRALDCGEAHRIVTTGRGLGRAWQDHGHGGWLSPASEPLRYWDIALHFDPVSGTVYAQPAAMGDDFGSAMNFCASGASAAQLPDVTDGPRAIDAA